ncbi:hypothetical protein HMPREF0063_10722 [Aeromicrobium marinum DSM 15272]|uniref:DnaJ homologue subfamily C member 28 conserved domain-containing protein n=1 Tax=Aeromicrobium marinum DSM 15272 TaxID=585531 RepID=E2S9T2_9ACTN|nr:DUF1992 domain-containing protein [Aeromicrobium marinum]EFQ84006.1 hypothetical protein HMPREF0063_10722 [Aeromicrobium marinum DSM 15272]
MDDHRRRAAHYRSDPDSLADEEAEQDPARGRRVEDTALWVDLQIRAAIERGEFDDLPLAGKPLPNLTTTHDPDWWVKQLIERERITGVLPPALQLRKDDAVLDDLLDRQTREESVRSLVEEFNARIVEARRQLTGGPPVITPLRDVEAEVSAWRERRRAAVATAPTTTDRPVGRRFLRRRRRG